MAEDLLSPEERSKHMGRIKSKNTKVEWTVRKLVWAMGYRYRLHRADLPGRPDMVFSKLRRVIFIHGCFWHQHDCLAGARRPKSRLDFWGPKLDANIARDKRNLEKLDELGWKVLVIWECEIKNLDSLALKILDFLEGKNESS